MTDMTKHGHIGPYHNCPVCAQEAARRSTQPTPGAMRAVLALRNASQEDELEKAAAAIIDRETGLPDLLAALESALADLDSFPQRLEYTLPDCVRSAARTLRAALAKAKQGGAV